MLPPSLLTCNMANLMFKRISFTMFLILGGIGLIIEFKVMYIMSWYTLHLSYSRAVTHFHHFLFFKYKKSTMCPVDNQGRNFNTPCIVFQSLLSQMFFYVILNKNMSLFYIFFSFNIISLIFLGILRFLKLFFEFLGTKYEFVVHT